MFQSNFQRIVLFFRPTTSLFVLFHSHLSCVFVSHSRQLKKAVKCVRRTKLSTNSNVDQSTAILDEAKWHSINNKKWRHADAKGYLVCLYETDRGMTPCCGYLMTRNANRLLVQLKSHMFHSGIGGDQNQS